MYMLHLTLDNKRFGERSGSVVEYLTRDQGAAGSSLTGVTVLCPFITEILLMGHKELNQTK